MEKCLGAEDEIHIFESDVGTSDIVRFAFGCYGCIAGIPYNFDIDEDVNVLPADNVEDEDLDIEHFYKTLQDLLLDGEAIIITEVGYEKLRYLIGISVVITCSEISVVNLHDASLAEARSLLRNPSYTTKLVY